MIDFNRYSAVGFDLDGTLVDSRQAFAKAFEVLLEKWSLKPQPLEVLSNLVGLHLKEVFDFIGLCVSKKDEFIRDLEEIYPNIAIENLRPFLNAGDVLRELKNKGYKLALVTSNSSEGAELSLRLCGIEINLFDSIVTSCNTSNQKPHPEPLLKAIGECEVSKENFLYFGDSKADFEAAENAGVDFKLLTHNDHLELENAVCSTHHIKSFKVIRNYIVKKKEPY